MSQQQFNLAGDISMKEYQGSTQQQHTDIDEQAWKELIQRIPDSEEKWRERRKYRFSDTPEMIHLVRRTLFPLLNRTPDFKIDPTRRIGMIQRIILLAAHEVARTFAPDADSFHDYVGQLLSQRSKNRPKRESLTKQARAVKKLIKEMDTLYNNKLRSRSFEAILLYAPLIPKYLDEYMNNTRKFTECFSECKPLEENVREIQGTLPLYIPFFVSYLLTHHTELKSFSLSYQIVCTNLKTSTYSVDEYREFVKAMEKGIVNSSNGAAMTNKAVPSSNTLHPEVNIQKDLRVQHSLSVPYEPSTTLERHNIGQSRHFDPIQSITIHPLDLKLATKDYYEGNSDTNFGRLENMSFPTLYISIGHFMVLAAEEELLQKADEVGKSQIGKNVTAKFSDDFFTYDWDNDLHDAVADQAIKDLVDSNIMKKGIDISRYKLSIYHASGGITTPLGVFQIVIPTVKPVQPSRIRITLQDTRVQVPVEWSSGSYFLLSEGTILSPTSPISYISIAVPLMSRTSDS